MRVLFMLVLFIFIALIGTYFYHFWKRFISLFHTEKKASVVKLIAVILAVLCAITCIQIYQISGVFMLHFLVINAMIDLLLFLIKRFKKEWKMGRVCEIMVYSGVLSILLIGAMFTYGYYNMGQVRRTEYTIETKKAIDKELKIAQISDLHTGTTMDATKLASYCDKLQHENVDLLLLTGDIVDEGTTREEMETVIQTIAKVPTTYGIYFVFGNHDYNDYTRTPQYSADELRMTWEKYGVRVLEDEIVQITDEITLIGRIDASKKRVELSQLLTEEMKDTFIILMDHQPVELEKNAQLGIDLQLSGHTHGGQIWPTGQIGELTGLVQLNYGLREIGEYRVIVSSGIAGWGYPIRTSGHSEYVIVNVK